MRIRRVLLVASAILLIGATRPSEAEDFAIVCTGAAKFENKVAGNVISRNYDLPPRTYVFNEADRRAQHAMMPRQQFEDICFRGSIIDRTDFAPGLINIRSESPGRLCDFSVSRITGVASYLSHSDMPDGGYSSIEFDMHCMPTDVPEFDKSRNRF